MSENNNKAPSKIEVDSKTEGVNKTESVLNTETANRNSLGTNSHSEDLQAKTKVWVDADACPVPIRDLLIRAAKRTGAQITFVANSYLKLPTYPSLKFIQVPKGFDIADNYIVQNVQARDLVVTQDIPLADEVITLGALAMNPRGQAFTKENIKSRLTMRDFMETMRASGVQSGGPAPFSKQDVQSFANQLDRWLAKNKATL